jgi:hypothetical protein
MKSRLATIGALLALAATGRAAPAGKLALVVDGRDAAKLQPAMAAATSAYRLVPPGQVKHEMGRARGKSVEARAASLAQRLDAAVLYARVDGKGKRVTLVLVRRGGPPSTRSLALPAALPAARRAVTAAVRELVEAAPATAVAAAPPAPPSPAPASPTPGPPAPPPPTPAPSPPPRTARRASAPPAPAVAEPTALPPSQAAEAAVVRSAPPQSPHDTVFSLALDGGVGARRLEYNQALTPNLPGYSVAAVPWLGLRAALYPLARTHIAVLRGLGAFVNFGHSVYQRSAVAGGGPVLSATWIHFDTGLRERLRFGNSRFAPTLGIALSYGNVVYDFEDGGQLVSGTPSVDYRYIRPALDGRVSFGPVTLFVESGYRAVLSSGYVGSRFPRAQVGGIDAGAGIELGLPQHFGLRLFGQYIRFFYDFHPEPGDPYVAGGAVDEFAIGELALAYAW